MHELLKYNYLKILYQLQSKVFLSKPLAQSTMVLFFQWGSSLRNLFCNLIAKLYFSQESRLDSWLSSIDRNLCWNPNFRKHFFPSKKLEKKTKFWVLVLVIKTVFPVIEEVFCKYNFPTGTLLINTTHSGREFMVAEFLRPINELIWQWTVILAEGFH